MNELTQSIKSEAKRLGFNLVRFIDAKKSEDFVNRFHNNFDDWISEYPYKELSYLVNRETERFKLNAYLKNVQSIICLGMNYYQIAKEEFDPLKQRKISRYAWGKDYHKVIEKRLKKLES